MIKQNINSNDPLAVDEEGEGVCSSFTTCVAVFDLTENSAKYIPSTQVPY